jgi:predicted ABC-type ATPase
MSQKFIILLNGPMGSGKTTTSKLLHESIVPSARVALPDVRRLMSGNHREHGEVTRQVMLDMATSYLQSNIPVIVETVCGEEYIKKCATLAEAQGCQFYPYYISADESLRWDRVCERTRQMMDVEELPDSKVKELEPIFADNNAFYAKQEGDLGEMLDTSDLAIEAVVQKIKEKVFQ